MLLSIPLVRRTRDPHEGLWALPGGWLDDAESLDAAAARTLAETTGSRPRYLEQLYAFGALDRSPAGRVVSIVYWALVRPTSARSATDERTCAGSTRTSCPRSRSTTTRSSTTPSGGCATRSGTAASRTGSSPRLHARRAARGLRGRPRPPLDPANFRRQVEASRHPRRHRPLRTGQPPPARLYRYNQAVELADRGPLATATEPDRMSTTMPSVAPDAPASSVDHRPAIVAGEPAETCNTDLADGPWDFDSTARLRPRLVDGRRDPDRLAASGRAARRVPRGVDDELTTRIRAAKADPRRPRRDPRPLLPARRGRPARRLRRATRSSSRTPRRRTPKPRRSSSAACTSWPRPPTSSPQPEQAVILPNLAAGCSMADMADIDQVEECWEQLAEIYGDRSRMPTAACPSSRSRT